MKTSLFAAILLITSIAHAEIKNIDVTIFGMD